jgi:hypothetical protein
MYKAVALKPTMLTPLYYRDFSKTYYPRIRQELFERGQEAILTKKNLGNVGSNPVKLRVRHPHRASKTVRMPPLRHDYMNFKVMGGNEILLNLENAKYLRDGELINALIELGKRKGQESFDWEVHPYTKIAFDEARRRHGQLEAKHVSQLCFALNRLNYNNNELWHKLSDYILRIVHTFDTRSLVNILDVFVPKIEEDLEDEVVYIDKEIAKKQKTQRCSDEFLQRIITIFPQHVKNLNVEQLVRVCEVCAQRNLGDKRLYKEFLFFYVEKRIAVFNIPQLVRILRVLGERRYTDDVIFWNNFIFPRIYLDPLNQKEAQTIWEALVALKLKCPELNCDIPINYIESILKKYEVMENYEELEQDQKDQVKETGDLPDGVRRTIQTHMTGRST